MHSLLRLPAGLPKLNPEGDISAIELVGPQTSKEVTESLYFEV